jgi:uncharacterized integral membrane protein (TIGR00697 family)
VNTDVENVLPGPLASRATRLFIVLATFLVANAVIAEFVGVKIFALEPTLGLDAFNWNLFGQSGSLSFTSGVRFISWLAVALISYGFLAAYIAISLVPAQFWVSVGKPQGVPDMQAAFASIFGQGMWTIGGSITAFLVGQLIDVTLFHRIRLMTGERWIWLRATGSTAVSQLADTLIVLYIAFVLGPQKWSISLMLAVGTVNYCYKLLMAFLLIPLLYLTRRAIRAYLGDSTVAALQTAARAAA